MINDENIPLTHNKYYLNEIKSLKCNDNKVININDKQKCKNITLKPVKSDVKMKRKRIKLKLKPRNVVFGMKKEKYNTTKVTQQTKTNPLKRKLSNNNNSNDNNIQNKSKSNVISTNKWKSGQNIRIPLHFTYHNTIEFRIKGIKNYTVQLKGERAWRVILNHNRNISSDNNKRRRLISKSKNNGYRELRVTNETATKIIANKLYLMKSRDKNLQTKFSDIIDT